VTTRAQLPLPNQKGKKRDRIVAPGKEETLRGRTPRDRARRPGVRWVGWKKLKTPEVHEQRKEEVRKKEATKDLGEKVLSQKRLLSVPYLHGGEGRMGL